MASFHPLDGRCATGSPGKCLRIVLARRREVETRDQNIPRGTPSPAAPKGSLNDAVDAAPSSLSTRRASPPPAGDRQRTTASSLAVKCRGEGKTGTVVGKIKSGRRVCAMRAPDSRCGRFDRNGLVTSTVRATTELGREQGVPVAGHKNKPSLNMRWAERAAGRMLWSIASGGPMTPVTKTSLRALLVSLCLVLAQARLANAQTVGMGISLFGGQGVNPTSVETRIAMNGASADGFITSASFAWTATPCPAAVKIKFFRPAFPSLLGTPPLTFLAERGPFDVTASLTSSYSGLLTAKQTVAITPEVEVHFGDLVAITNLTSCGGPVYTYWALLSPPPAGNSLVVPGDVTTTVTSGRTDLYIDLTATGSSPALLLLSRRFAVTLTAMDPRTGSTADGLPIPLGIVGGSAGYFSLPAFTGDPTFPEVTVKMVDATTYPSLGGDFWFFHAPLTDTQYTLTVKDQYTGRVRTYLNGSASPGQLCGGADTSAFPPQ